MSPDGHKLAVFKGGAYGGIWLVDLANGTSTRLTSEGPNSWPLWTPDGKRILFSQGPQFVTIAADGSGARERVMPVNNGAAYPASYSADGKWLAYLEINAGTYRIWTKPMPGPGEPKLFTESKLGIGNAGFSPDGRWILYTSGESGANEVYVQAFPGPGEKHRISTAGGWNPAWARNGRELFYFESRSGGKQAVMAVDFSTGGDFKAGTPHELFDGPWETTTPLRSYDVTPDGRFILFRTETPPDERVAKLNVVLNWFSDLSRRAR